MKTTFEIRTPDLSGIYIGFDNEHDAMRYWRDEIERLGPTDLRCGAVVVRSVRETATEKETARLDFLLSDGGIAKFARACLTLGGSGADWPNEARQAIDLARNAPAPEVHVIWPQK